MSKSKKEPLALWLKVVGFLLVAVIFFAVGLNVTLFQGNLFEVGEPSFNNDQFEIVNNNESDDSLLKINTLNLKDSMSPKDWLNSMRRYRDTDCNGRSCDEEALMKLGAFSQIEDKIISLIEEGDLERANEMIREFEAQEFTSNTTNQKPTITNMKYTIDTAEPRVGTKFKFTAIASDPDGDQIKYQFFVCKYGTLVCNNAMNGSKEDWTYKNNFSWTAPSIGDYQIHVNVIDGYHASESNPFGDDQYNLYFDVYDNKNIGTGEIAIEQMPVVGTVKVQGKSSKIIKSEGESYQATVGDYTLNITPPAGYVLDKVVDWNKSLTTPLVSPYKQTLKKGASITYLVTYKKLGATQKGSLSATSISGAIVSDIIVGGTTDALVAQYTFEAKNEAFDVKKFTIINDLSGVFNTPQSTNAVSNIKVVYSDQNGVDHKVMAPLSNGRRTFVLSGGATQPYFRVPKNKTATLKIYASTTAITSGRFSISGKHFRIGLMEGSVNTSTTFEAVGVSSSNVTYLNKAGDIKNSSNVSQFVVRKSKPVFAKGYQARSNMPTTNGNLYNFTVKADGDDISFSRLVFNLNTNGLFTGLGEDIYNFDFLKNNLSISDVNIYGYSTSGLPRSIMLKGATYGSGLALANAGGSSKGVNDGLYKIVVTFNNEEVITAGKVNNYTLRASIKGATTSDTLSVGLADDTSESIVLGGFDNDNDFSNTAHIIGSGKISGLFDSLFYGISGAKTTDEERFFGSKVDMKYGTVPDRNIIWSDQSGGDIPNSGGTASAKLHSYPKISNGKVTDYSGTVDWTNGYLLGIGNLDSFNFKK